MAQELQWFDADAPKAAAGDYDKFITAASKRYDVPEHWIRTVIEHESKGNSKAWRAEPQKGEGVGSRGLMQIMPDTAHNLGFKGDDFDELYQPETNIDLGTKLLGQLRKQHGDDFEKVYSAYNSGNAEAYKTNPDVKAHVEAANKVFNSGVDWHDADDNTSILAQQARKYPTAKETGGKEGVVAPTPKAEVQPADASSTGWTAGVQRNLRNIWDMFNSFGTSGVSSDPKKVAANVEQFRKFLEGSPADVIAANTPAGIGTQVLDTARRAKSGDIGGAAADIVVPLAVGEAVPMALKGGRAVTKAAGDFATDYRPSGETLKTAVKGGAKIVGSSVAAAAETHIPGAGIPLGIATELIGLKGGIADLVEAARKYKGDIYANKLAKTLSKKAEYIPSPTPSNVPSWQDMAGEEAPIEGTAVNVPRKQIGDQSRVTGISAEEPIQEFPNKQIPTTLGDFQRLTAAPERLMLPAPTEGATVATQTAPGEGGVPTATAEPEKLPAAYQQAGPKTPAGTTALVGKQPTVTGEQTVTGTPKTETPADLAFEYGEKNKFDVKHEQVTSDEAHSKKIAEFYDKAESNPKDPAVKKAYRAFNKETHDQYEFLVKKGYTFEPTETSTTYPDAETMWKDVNDNKHLKVWNGGSPQHGLMTAQQNFEFRAVHDIFGHTAPEATFGHQGEETAYFAHKSMYSAEAQKAMATETRGQNAAVHFGEVNNDPSTIYENSLAGNGGKLKFPEQKAIILPKELREASRPQTAGKPKTEPAAKMPFKDWMKRMTPNQLKHVRAALDLVEDESKYDELQKAIDEATEK